MNNVERIRYTISLRENKKELEEKKEFIDRELRQLQMNEIHNQNDCSHIAFRFGGTENTQGFTKCLICNKELNAFDYAVLQNLDLIVNANVYRDKGLINIFGYNYENLRESLFAIFQNKFLELSETYPEKDKREIIEMLNKMIENDEQKELIQSLDEYLKPEAETEVSKKRCYPRKKLKV